MHWYFSPQGVSELPVKNFIIIKLRFYILVWKNYKLQLNKVFKEKGVIYLL